MYKEETENKKAKPLLKGLKIKTDRALYHIVLAKQVQTETRKVTSFFALIKLQRKETVHTRLALTPVTTRILVIYNYVLEFKTLKPKL